MALLFRPSHRRPSIAAVLVLTALTSGCQRAATPPENPSPGVVVTPTIAAPVPAPPAEKGAPEFVEIASAAGVQFTYHNGQEALNRAILEMLGGGIGLFDYDGDGWLDMVLPGGGRIVENKSLTALPTGLFRQTAPLKFSASAEAARCSEATHYSHGVAVGDFNQDGFPDFLITGYGGVQLWVNQGDGTFEERAAQAGLNDTLWSTSAAWADLNRDGALDLYVTHYVDWSFQKNPPCEVRGQREYCAPHWFDGLPDALYLGNGDGTFRSASAEAGLRTDAAGRGLGVVIGDIDDDGDSDVYVANDTSNNFLYLNDGQGELTEVGEITATAFDDHGLPNGSMGVELFDFNRDGLMDIWVTNYENESFALYRNLGQGQFRHVTRSTGIAVYCGPLVGFGTVAADFNHDGEEDLFVANGHVVLFTLAPLRQKPLFLFNEKGRFHRGDFPTVPYFVESHLGRGVAAGDLDRDGDLDIVISQLNDPAAILRNDLAQGGWLRVRLIGVHSNRDAVGAQLTLHTSAGKMMRQIKGGGSYLSHSDTQLHWGLPQNAVIERLVIRWPNGHEQEITPTLNQSLTVVEPTP